MKENMLPLMKFAPLEYVSKLCTDYLAATRDPSVFVEDDRSAYMNPPATINQNAGMEWATWRPRALMASYKEDRSDTNIPTSTLHHIMNFVARNRWNGEGNNADNVPSSYLVNVEVSSIQTKLFNPTLEDLIMGVAVSETMGEGAKKKLAKRRLEAMGEMWQVALLFRIQQYKSWRSRKRKLSTMVLLWWRYPRRLRRRSS